MTRCRGRHARSLVLFAALVSTLASAAALVVGPAPAAAVHPAGEADRAVAAKAVAYLATQQQPDGGFEVAGFPGFETPEAVLAVAAAAQDWTVSGWSSRLGLLAVQALATANGRTALDALDDLADATGDDAITPGLAAKLITLVAGPLCLNPAAFDPQHDGPTNLVARMLSGQRENGAFGPDGAFSFTLYAMLGLATVGAPVPPETVAYVKAAQEDDGSYNFAGDPSPSPSEDFDDIDTTGLAIQALVVSAVPPGDPSIADALAFLDSRQADDGSWNFGDPNSTAVAAMALETVYRPITRTEAAYTFLRSLQQADGRIASPNDAFGINTYATTQTVRALMGASLPRPSSGCANDGYVLFAGDGGVFRLGGAPWAGSMGGARLNSPIVNGAVTPVGEGYALFAADGGVFTFGDARFSGSMGAVRLNSPIVAGAFTLSGRGYALFAADGGVFTFGDARFFGSMGAVRLNSPIVGGAITPSGRGYALFAADGGVFTFGDARFSGSMGAVRLNSPIVDGAVTPTGRGYLLVAADGGLFTFGDADFLGSLGGRAQAAPIVGMSVSPTGRGYLLFGSDASAFGFGDATRAVPLAGVTSLRAPVVGGGIA